MGFMDKLKALFKKKGDSGAKDAAAPKKKASSRAAMFNGQGKVADALKYAAEKIDAKIAAGGFDDKRGDMFVAQLKDIEASDASEDVKLTQISQVIGGIINA